MRNNKLFLKQFLLLRQTVTAALLRNCIIAKIETLRSSALFPNEFGFHIDSLSSPMYISEAFTEKYGSTLYDFILLKLFINL